MVLFDKKKLKEQMNLNENQDFEIIPNSFNESEFQKIRITIENIDP